MRFPQPSVFQVFVFFFKIFIMRFTSLFLFQCNIFSFVVSVKKIVWMGKMIKVAENKQNRKAEEQGEVDRPRKNE